MNPYLFTWSATAIAITFAIAVLYLHRYRTRHILVREFIFYLLACIVWLCGNTYADLSHTYTGAFISSGTAFIGGAFVASFFLTFVHTFTENARPSSVRYFIYLIPGIFFSVMAFTPLSIKDIYTFPNAPSQVEPGIMYPTSLLVLIGIVIYSLFKLKKAYNAKETDILKKKQIIFMGISFAAVIVGQLIFTLILPLFGYLNYFNVAPQFTLIFALASSYAIFAYNLFDIKIVLQRSLIYFIIFSGIVAMYTLSLSIYTNKLTASQSALNDIVLGVCTTLIALITVPRFDRYLRKITDPFFFSDSYVYKDALHDLSKTLQESTNIEILISLSEKKLAQVFRSTYAYIRKQTIADNDVVIPIPGNDETAIILGPKRSGASYTNEDMLLLQTFANQAAVAINRALLFQELKTYAAELESRVTERTEDLHRVQESQKRTMLQLSHNLQTPLAILLNQLEKIRSSTTSYEQFIPLERAVKDVSTFIARLLKLARLESGQGQFTRSHFSLSSLITDILEEVSVIAQDAERTIEISIAQNCNITGVESQLREVFLNILSNALKYSDIHSTITVALQKTKDGSQFSCKNQGSFINRKDIGHIFTPFYRSKEKETIPGTGLGLAISKEIVEQHNGTISVTSSKTKGTCFTCTFPGKTDQK